METETCNLDTDQRGKQMSDQGQKGERNIAKQGDTTERETLVNLTEENRRK